MVHQTESEPPEEQAALVPRPGSGDPELLAQELKGILSGLPAEQAAEVVASAGWISRISEVDGVPLPARLAGASNRVNLVVNADQLVTDLTIG